MSLLLVHLQLKSESWKGRGRYGIHQSWVTTLNCITVDIVREGRLVDLIQDDDLRAQYEQFLGPVRTA